jgi:hypothetical protein
MNISGAVVTAVIALAFFQIHELSNIFILPIAHVLKLTDLSRLPVLALPLAFSFGAVISALLLFFSLPKQVKVGVSSDLISAISETLIASAVLVFVVALSLRFFNDYLVLDTAINVFLHGLFSGISGIVAWFITLKVFKNRELNEITSRVN